MCLIEKVADLNADDCETFVFVRRVGTKKTWLNISNSLMAQYEINKCSNATIACWLLRKISNFCLLIGPGVVMTDYIKLSKKLDGKRQNSKILGTNKKTDHDGLGHRVKTVKSKMIN